jgi:hypothetical protein
MALGDVNADGDCLRGFGRSDDSLADLDRCWLALGWRRAFAVWRCGALLALLATAAAAGYGLCAADFYALGLTFFSAAGRLHFASVGGTLGLTDCLWADGSGGRFGWGIVAIGLCGGLVGRVVGGSVLSRSVLSGRLLSRSFFGSGLLYRSVSDDLLGSGSLFFWSFGLCRLVSHL